MACAGCVLTPLLGSGSLCVPEGVSAPQMTRTEFDGYAECVATAGFLSAECRALDDKYIEATGCLEECRQQINAVGARTAEFCDLAPNDCRGTYAPCDAVDVPTLAPAPADGPVNERDLIGAASALNMQAVTAFT